MAVREQPQSGERGRESGSTCSAPSCWRDGVERRVDGREAVLCATHAKLFLGVST